jgi:hypothetical protein
LISPSPSIASHRAFTTLPTISFQTGTLRVLPVAFTVSPSEIEVKPSKTTIQTKCSSKLRAIHFAPDSNSTTSL